MPIFKTEAIVLKRTKLAESDLIITFFTKNFGKAQCVVKGARKIKSRYGGRFEPFAGLNIIYSGKEHQNLYFLRHCDIIKPYYKLREDYDRLITGLYFTEIVNYFTREAQKSEEIYDLLFRMLELLQYTESPSLLTRVFEMKTIALSGYTPRLHTCLICQKEPVDKNLNLYFQRGGIICGKCLNGNSPGRRITLGILSYLKKTLTINLDSIERLKFPKELEKEIGLITQIYLKTIIGKEFKSYKLLHS